MRRSYTLHIYLVHCSNITGVLLQSQLAELRARQESAEEAHRQEIARQNEAHRQELARQFEAFQQHQQRQMQDFANYFTSLQIPGVVTPPLPASLFAPLPLPGTVVQSPVSIYECILLCLLWTSYRY